MARRRPPQQSGEWPFPNLTSADQADDRSSLLDVVDNVLNRGAVVTGDVVLGVADVDLVYLKLSVLLAAIDKVTKDEPIFRPVAAGPNRKPAKGRPARRRQRTKPSKR